MYNIMGTMSGLYALQHEILYNNFYNPIWDSFICYKTSRSKVYVVETLKYDNINQYYF